MEIGECFQFLKLAWVIVGASGECQKVEKCSISQILFKKSHAAANHNTVKAMTSVISVSKSDNSAGVSGEFGPEITLIDITPNSNLLLLLWAKLLLGKQIANVC